MSNYKNYRRAISEEREKILSDLEREIIYLERMWKEKRGKSAGTSYFSDEEVVIDTLPAGEAVECSPLIEQKKDNISKNNKNNEEGVSYIDKSKEGKRIRKKEENY